MRTQSHILPTSTQTRRWNGEPIGAKNTSGIFASAPKVEFRDLALVAAVARRPCAKRCAVADQSAKLG